MIAFKSGEDCCCGGAKQIMVSHTRGGVGGGAVYQSFAPNPFFVSTYNYLTGSDGWNGPSSFTVGQLIKWHVGAGVTRGTRIYRCIAPVINSPNPLNDPAHWQEVPLTSGFGSTSGLTFDVHRRSKGEFSNVVAYVVGDIASSAGIFYRCHTPTVGNGNPANDPAHWEFYNLRRDPFMGGSKTFLRWRETTTWNFAGMSGEGSIRPAAGIAVREYLMDRLTKNIIVTQDDPHPSFESFFNSSWQPLPNGYLIYYPNDTIFISSGGRVGVGLSDIVISETSQIYTYTFRSPVGTGTATQKVEIFEEYTVSQFEADLGDLFAAVDFDDLQCGQKAVPFFNPLGVIQINTFPNAQPESGRLTPNTFAVILTKAWVDVLGPYCEVSTPAVGEATCVSKDNCGPVILDPPGAPGTVRIEQNCTCAP